jgi:glycosyltransferase involved in cell wall biosynthesis
VKVLIFHGWLLRGTGSNVYNASLAAALARQGHEVHLICQDREAPDLGAGAPGSVTIHNPDIGGLLPVFVHDTYEGFEVKTFGELTDGELDGYIEANVAAVRGLVDELGGVDAALANHLIMAPVILRRAGLDYALKVHGSDLSYTVLPDLERFGPYAREAAEGAAGILVGSGHIAARLRRAVDEPAVNARVRLGPPGVDTELFAPGGGRGAAVRPDASGGGGSAWDRDSDAAAAAVAWYAEGDGAHVIFVGKLIVSKGIDLLLAAWPLVRRAHPGARLLVVGFGSLEPALRRIAEGFAAGDLAPLRELAERGWALEGGDEKRLRMLSAFLEAAPEGYADDARRAGGSIRFAGRLEHDEVAPPVAGSDALVFPSTFPEAFGMVAAEAAAAGALPVSANHSGAAEVSRELAADLAPELRDLVSFDLDDGAVEAIAERLDRWLALDPGERERAGAALRATVERLWSWDGVARAVLAAAAGRLDGLPRPADSGAR